MNLRDKIEKGSKYLVDQCEQKLNGLGAIENGKFIPADPKAYKKHKVNIEFRLRFCDAVDELLKQHILLSEGVVSMVTQLEESGEINEEDLEGLKQYALKFKEDEK